MVKNLIVFLFIVIFTIGCSIKEKRLEFLITKIEQEKDGQMLFLKNDKNEVFTTIISIPNGNYIEVDQGNKIALEIIEVIKMKPPIIISKNIQLLED
ncbi:hypothetical protein [Aquimarina rhabdastrellae]